MTKYISGSKLACMVLAVVLSVAAAAPALAAVRLEKPENVYWAGSDPDEDVGRGTYAYWDEVDGADRYEIYLYCDESRVRTVRTDESKFNFRRMMTKEGDYTFRVRALAKKKDREYRDGSWSDYSDSTYIDSSFAELMRNGGVVDTYSKGPGAKQDGAGNQSHGAVIREQWVKDDKGWRYSRADGLYPANEWFRDPADGCWYFFDADGYMMTGWIDWDGQRYYCDGGGTPSGAMVTGSRTIDGISYEFDESGALIP